MPGFLKSKEPLLTLWAKIVEDRQSYIDRQMYNISYLLTYLS